MSGQESGSPGQSDDPAKAKRVRQSPAKPRAAKQANPATPADEASATREPEEPMLDPNLPHVHAPHQGVRSWRDFCVHIAIIVIGLVIAVSLEQMVEYIHNERERAQFDVEMREVLESNSLYLTDGEKKLGGLRAYLVELQAAVVARRYGRVAPPSPPLADKRNTFITFAPRLGPFEAAKANGTVALLSLNKIEIYEALAYQVDGLKNDREHLRVARLALNGFRMRFDTTRPLVDTATAYLPADLNELSSSELADYQALIGDTLSAVDEMDSRMRRLEGQSRAFLNGARTETEMMEAVGYPKHPPSGRPSLPSP